MTKCVIRSDTRRRLSQHPCGRAIPSRSPSERITSEKDWGRQARDQPCYSQELPGTFRSRFLGLAYASVSLKQQSGLGLGMVFLSGQIPSDLRGWAPDIVLIESQRRRRIAKLAHAGGEHREPGSVDKGEENSSRRCGTYCKLYPLYEGHRPSTSVRHESYS
jgi:hypothetical protein